MRRSGHGDIVISALVPLISAVCSPLDRPALERLSAHYARYRRSELPRPAHSLYTNVAVLSMDPISELMRLDAGPIRLHVHGPKKKAFGAHEIIVWVDRPARVANDIRSHFVLF